MDFFIQTFYTDFLSWTYGYGTVLNWVNKNMLQPQAADFESRPQACVVGWSDIELFSYFENGHYAADQVYFYDSKKSANLAVRAALARQSFNVKK